MNIMNIIIFFDIQHSIQHLFEHCQNCILTVKYKIKRISIHPRMNFLESVPIARLCARQAYNPLHIKS